MNEALVDAVIEALFEKLKEKEANHPLVVKILNGVEKMAEGLAPELIGLVQSKLGGK